MSETSIDRISVSKWNRKESDKSSSSEDDFFSFLEEDLPCKDVSSEAVDKSKMTQSAFDAFEEHQPVKIVKPPSLKKEGDDECIRCGSINTLCNDGENMVCTECGCENSMVIDTNAEWRFYGSDDNKYSSDPNRCGLPSNPYIKNSSLSIVILGHGFEKYRKINSWNGLSYKERSLMTILNMVMNKANIENVPQSVIDKTIHDYQTICTSHVKRGTSRESLIAACFAQAMREHGFIRSHQEIAHLFNIKTKKLSKGYNEFTEFMYKQDKDYAKKIKPVETKELVKSYGEYLDFSEEQKKSCMLALYGVEKLGLCPENNPKSIAVGIIYLISEHYHLPYTKKDIADYCKTSDVTVGGTYSQMMKHVKYLIPGRQ